MKQKKINTKLLTAFILMSLFSFFISCEKNADDIIQENPQTSYKIKIVYGENFFKEYPNIRNEIKTKSQLSLQSRMISDEYNFEIDETKVQIIETNSYDVYTFKIERDTPSNNLLENYILIQHANDSIEHYIAKYPFTIINGEKVFNNNASIIKITNPNLVYSARSVDEHIANPNCEWVPYFTTQTVFVSGERCGCHGNHIYGDNLCDCPSSPPTPGTYESIDITIWKYECYSGGGSGNSGSNPSGGDSSGGYGGSSNNQDILTAPFGKDFNDDLWESQLLLLANLTIEQQNWWNNTSSITTQNSILNYLNSNNNSDEAIDFVKDFIDSDNNSGLDLDFEKSKKSPANIDVTEIDTTTTEGKKFDCIYKKLMESNSFKNLFVKTFGGTQTKFNVKFEIADSFPNPTTEGNCQMITTNNGTTFTNLIKIKRSLLQENSNGIGNGSNIKIAKIIIHELIHAYLNIKKVNCNQGATLPFINNLELGELIQSFYQNFNCEIDFNGSPQSQHSFMFDFLIPTFQSIFQETRDSLISDAHIQYANSIHFSDDSLGIDEQWNWDDFYKYVTLNGLHQCESFNLEITNNPTENFLYNFYKTYENSVTKTCL